MTIANGTNSTSGSPTPTALAGGLVSYWTLDEGTGMTAVDSSGNGNTATLVNAPTWTAGRNGSALAFDGLTQYVRVPSTPALDAYPLTVAFWMKTASTTGVRGVINKYAAYSLNGWHIYMNAGKLCAWYIKDASSYIDDNSACPLAVAGYNDNQWHQVVFVVDASGGKFYIDGLPQAALAWTGTPGAPTTTQELQIGHYPGLSSGGFFAGLIDDVRIWSNAWPNGFPVCENGAADPRLSLVPSSWLARLHADSWSGTDPVARRGRKTTDQAAPPDGRATERREHMRAPNGGSVPGYWSTGSGYKSGGAPVKSAFTERAALMVTVHVLPDTESQPLHPVNRAPVAAVAVSVTTVPAL